MFVLTIDPHVGASPANGSLAPIRSLLLYEGGTVGTLTRCRYHKIIANLEMSNTNVKYLFYCFYVFIQLLDKKNSQILIPIFNWSY